MEQIESVLEEIVHKARFRVEVDDPGNLREPTPGRSTRVWEGDADALRYWVATRKYSGDRDKTIVVISNVDCERLVVEIRKNFARYIQKQDDILASLEERYGRITWPEEGVIGHTFPIRGCIRREDANYDWGEPRDEWWSGLREFAKALVQHRAIMGGERTKLLLDNWRTSNSLDLTQYTVLNGIMPDGEISVAEDATLFPIVHFLPRDIPNPIRHSTGGDGGYGMVVLGTTDRNCPALLTQFNQGKEAHKRTSEILRNKTENVSRALALFTNLGWEGGFGWKDYGMADAMCLNANPLYSRWLGEMVADVA